jgi:hypothetical protein
MSGGSCARWGPCHCREPARFTTIDFITSTTSGAESLSFGSALIFVLTAVLPARHYGQIMRRILLTTPSFQDIPREHHKLMADAGFEFVRGRGPLPEPRMLELVSKGDFDGWLIGDAAITRAAIEKSLPRLKVISKYSVGLDKVDVKAAPELNGDKKCH